MSALSNPGSRLRSRTTILCHRHPASTGERDEATAVFFQPALRQPIKTLGVNVKVVVREGESLPSALLRLRMQARLAYRRQWSKTRMGAYEKPSYRRRKRESLRKRNASTVRYRKRSRAGCTVYLGLPQLMSREEVYQRKRLPFKSRRRWWGDEE